MPRRVRNNYSGRIKKKKKLIINNETEYTDGDGYRENAGVEGEAWRKKAPRVRSTLISRLIISAAAAQTDELGTRDVYYIIYVYMYVILYDSYTLDCSFFLLLFFFVLFVVFS